MVLDEVRFAPLCIETSGDSVFKHKRYMAYLPPRNDNELITEVELRLFKDENNIKFWILNSFYHLSDWDSKRKYWTWDTIKKHEPCNVSLEELQQFLSEIGYEVHKITLLEND